jgi:phosphinothricin acetyltransferase
MRSIRIAGPDDADLLARIYAPYVEQSAISFELEPPSPAELAGRIATTLSYAPWLVLADGPALLGYAYATKHRDRAAYRWSVDSSVYVGAAAKRTGVGRALYRSLFALLRLQGFHRVHAGITLPNAASVGLHESFGFEPVGIYRGVGYKAGRWHDVGWWQLSLEARVGEAPAPPPPRSMAELRAHPHFLLALESGGRAEGG